MNKTVVLALSSLMLLACRSEGPAPTPVADQPEAAKPEAAKPVDPAVQPTAAPAAPAAPTDPAAVAPAEHAVAAPADPAEPAPDEPVAAAPAEPAADAAAAVVLGPDLLSHSAGAVVHSVTSVYNSGTTAEYLLDGELETLWRANTDVTDIQHAVFELAARASVTRVAFGVNERVDWAKGQAVTVAIAATPEGPWTDIAAGSLSPGGFTVAPVEPPVEGRYVRVTLPARASVDAPSVDVSEVVIEGAFVEQIPTADFTGLWNGGWLLGRYRLVQDSIRVRGCFEDNRQIEGTVDGRVAMLRFINLHGFATVGEFVMSSAEEKPYLLQLFENKDYPPTQAFGSFDTVGDVECRIIGVDPDETAKPAEVAVDPIEAELDKSGRALVYDILFDFNKATLRPESGAVLDRITAILRTHPEWHLAIEGHTDSVGTAIYNQQLSERRAQATMAALIERGIERERLKAAGFGLSKPVADNTTAGGRALNRRVELARATN